MLPLIDRDLLTQTMVGLNMDAETISSLMASFDRAADTVESSPVPRVPRSAFGGSPTGQQLLGLNADLAHEAVAEELTKMAAGLRGMGTSVEQFGNDMERTTEQTTATMNLIETSTDCVAAPTFHSGATCSVPTGDEG